METIKILVFAVIAIGITWFILTMAFDSSDNKKEKETDMLKRSQGEAKIIDITEYIVSSYRNIDQDDNININEIGTDKNIYIDTQSKINTEKSFVFFEKWTCAILLTFLHFIVLSFPLILFINNMSRFVIGLMAAGSVSLPIVFVGSFLFFLIFKYILKKHVSFIIFYNSFIILGTLREIISVIMIINNPSIIFNNLKF